MVRGSVLVAGSRSLSVSPSVLAAAVASVAPVGWLVLSGGAMGMDRVAPAAALLLGRESVVFRPDYVRYGRRAPLVRNEEMVQLASAVVVVWDGRSRGTGHVVGRARALGLPLVVLSG